MVTSFKYLCSGKKYYSIFYKKKSFIRKNRKEMNKVLSFIALAFLGCGSEIGRAHV